MDSRHQHRAAIGRDDGIDWYPWGREAFAAAAREHKPMRITISTPVLQHRQQERDRDVVRLTRRYFIPVRVDRQEHPDVAAVYGQAASLLTGLHSDWMEVLADSAGNPFYIAEASTAQELAGLLSGVALHWSSDSAPYESVAALMRQRLDSLGRSFSEAAAPQQLWENHYLRLQRRYDRENGGFLADGKRLMPQELLFLMAYTRYTGDKQALGMAAHALRQMAMGAVRDHIGGGFFRGTTDARWEKPLQEKRLTDQAWMLRCYTEAYRETGEELFRSVAKEIADYVIRELCHSGGGFYAGQWSEDGYYHLTALRVRTALGDNDGSLFCREYSVGENLTLPHLFNAESPTEESALLHDLRMRLYRERLERGNPERDERVLTGQNGLMIAALAFAGRVFGVERYLTAAANAEDFLRSRLVTATELLRQWQHGYAAVEATLEDYAGYAMGLWELYRCGCGGEYLRHAAKVMARADALFSDGTGGGYFLSRGQRSLPARPKQVWEDDAPTAWSVALKVLVQLAREIPHGGLRRRTAQQLEFAAGAARSYDCAYALTAMMDA